MKKLLTLLTALIFILATVCAASFSAFATEADPTLPNAYNSDPNGVQYSTSIKSQGEYGNCWAFAAIACCEADAIKNHNAAASGSDAIDLSELHLAYFSYSGEREGTGDVVTPYAPFHQNGGYSQLPIFTLSSWIGLVDEDVAKYSDFVSNPSITLDESLISSPPEYYLQNAYTYSYPDDKDAIKQAILSLGAVQTAYYSDNYYYNETTSSQYCPINYTSDHAVTIVGWDDNYSKTKFRSNARPSNDGAWLVKNSWGESWGENGYFWLSYEDATITEATAFDVIPAEDACDNNYQHDGGISLSYATTSDITLANIFTAKGNEELTSVGITTYEISNANYELKIYLNPTNLTPAGFNDDDPIYTQTGVLENTGFNTIALEETIALKKDDVFIICIKTDSYVALDSTYQINSQGSLLISSTATVSPNQTYLAMDGSDFYDTSSSSNGSNPFNARIKAFTKNLTLGEASFISLPVASEIKYGQTLSCSALSGGDVVDSLSGKKIQGAWSFKTPSAILENQDSATVVFTPDNPHYESIEKTVKITVSAAKPTLSLLTNKELYKGGDTVRVSATVKNAYSQTLTDLPTIAFCYTVNDGAEIYFDGSFTLPENISGMKITIKAIAQAVDGKYETLTDSVSFSTEAQTPNDDNENNENNENNESNESDNSGESGGTQSNPSSPSNQNNQSNQSNQSNQNNQSGQSSATPSENGNSSAQSASNDSQGNIEDKLNAAVDKSFSSCLSSVSLSTLISVCAIGAFCSIKRRKK